MALSWQNLDLLRAILPELLVRGDLAARYRESVLEPSTRADEAVLDRLVRRGQAPATDRGLTVRVIAATFIGLAVLRLLGDPPVDRDPDDLSEALARILLDGIDPSSR